jgi:tetrahydromethanopterin S-methyltransferase subunit G
LTGALDVALGSFNKIQKNVDEVEETMAFEEEEQEEQDMNVVEVDTIQQSEVIDDAAFVPAPEMDTNGAINQAETIEEKLENMKVEEYLEED